MVRYTLQTYQYYYTITALEQDQYEVLWSRVQQY